MLVINVLPHLELFEIIIECHSKTGMKVNKKRFLFTKLNYNNIASFTYNTYALITPTMLHDKQIEFMHFCMLDRVKVLFNWGWQWMQMCQWQAHRLFRYWNEWTANKAIQNSGNPATTMRCRCFTCISCFFTIYLHTHTTIIVINFSCDECICLFRCEKRWQSKQKRPHIE